MNAKYPCGDCVPDQDGRHQPSCVTQWSDDYAGSGTVNGDACAVCGAQLRPSESIVCERCADDWGQITRTVEQWRKAKGQELALRLRVTALAIYLCDQKGFSEVQAAAMLGVSRPTIRAWRGK